MRIKRLLLVLVYLFIAGCSSQKASPSISIYIPQKCILLPNTSITVSLSGTNIPANPDIKWVVDRGTISSANGMSANFTAPDTPGPVVIKVLVSSDNLTTTTEKSCMVEATSTGTIVVSPSAEILPSLVAPTITPTAVNVNYTIAITEVMANPCYDDKLTYVNEYIEIYNFGTNPIDVGGLLITTTNQKGSPDKIINWFQRNPDDEFGHNLVLNSTVLESHKFAVVLSPLYTLSKTVYYLPYNFPVGTTILTIAEGDRIGNKEYGLLGNEEPLDSILLYKGTSNIINAIISTYGLNSNSIDLKNLSKARVKGLPLVLPDCYSAQRKIPAGDDIPNNWGMIPSGNPGSGNY